MRERPRHRLVWAVILSAAGLAAIPGCDNTVNIKTLTLSLRNIYPVGSSYTNDAGEPGATCEVNDRSFDLKLLLLGNTKERDKTLVREGDRLMNCTFTLDRGDSPCALNKRTVKITDSHVQRLSRICADDGDCGGDGWTCNTTDKVCETSLGLSVLQASSEPPRDAEFVLNGRADERRAKGRFVALLIDNSGSIRGNSSPPQVVPGSQPQTDPNDERLAAARSLLGSLDPETDRVGVWEMKGEAANVEQSLTQGFYAPNSTKVRQAIDEMRQSEGEGTPIWDAVVNAADAIRAAANLDVHIPSIIIFTDGYRMQDKTGEDAWTPYPNPAGGTTMLDALDAVQHSTHPIPVFIVHLENVQAVATQFGRDTDLAELACASGGAYYRVEVPEDAKGPFETLFQHASIGHYRLRIGYEGLKDARFPSGEEYAITAHITFSIDETERGIDLIRRAPLGGGRRLDTRVFVTKP